MGPEGVWVGCGGINAYYCSQNDYTHKSFFRSNFQNSMNHAQKATQINSRGIMCVMGLRVSGGVSTSNV